MGLFLPNDDGDGDGGNDGDGGDDEDDNDGICYLPLSSLQIEFSILPRLAFIPPGSFVSVLSFSGLEGFLCGVFHFIDASAF